MRKFLILALALPALAGAAPAIARDTEGHVPPPLASPPPAAPSPWHKAERRPQRAAPSRPYPVVARPFPLILGIG